MESRDLTKLIFVVFWVKCFVSCAEDPHLTRALQLMSETPLIDGHNDLPWQMRLRFNNQLSKVDLNTYNGTHTNIPKIKEGRLGAQFWSAYVPCASQYKDAVRQTFEQIDVVHRMCQKYPNVFMFASSSQDILDAFEQNKTASLIGVEGGHSIDSSLGTLRTMYQLGVRYLTLTHSCNTPWADNWLEDTSSEPSQHNGLSPFGKQVITEMNRLGMLIDLAHVTVKVMEQVLEMSQAPVIFSHSSAYSICNHKRNVPDHILTKVVIQTSRGYKAFYFLTLFVFFLDHFDHIKKVGGPEIVGFGGDYDGVTRLPQGLEDVSKVPNVVAELLRRGWTDEDVKAALGGNLLRVMKKTEEIRDSLRSREPDDAPIPYEQVENPCRTSYGSSDCASLSFLFCVLHFYLATLNRMLR
uniref:Dipeptidase n=1 Tax=Periophthalmus magnuspinnatus TaxID=409849 RepID=A0A3B4AIM8_9GOBI